MAETLPVDLLSGVREELEHRCGLRLGEVTDVALERAIRQAAAAAGIASLPAFAEAIRVHADPDATTLQHLLRKVTVGETSFFRHPEDIRWLRQTMLPRLVEKRQAEGDRRIRIWSAGCSTGEEAYTLAILAIEAVPPGEDWQIQVLATDINDESLDAARKAVYGEWSFRGVGATERDAWFEPIPGGGSRPVDAARRRVTFDYLNLRDPIYPAIFSRTTELDLVVCRNVFLYFYAARITDALQRFAACIRPDGWILCGPADLFHLEEPLPFPLFAGRDTPNRLRLAQPGDAVAPVELALQAGLPRRPRGRTWTGSPVQTEERPKSPTAGDRETAQRQASVLEQEQDVRALVHLLRAGRYAQAEARARELSSREPLSIAFVRCLALALSNLGDDRAADAWRRLLYLDANDPEAHLGMGMFLHQRRRHVEARRHFKKVIALLHGRADSETLGGPDDLSIAWVRSACQSLANAREEDG